jgi:hypothetical protein
MPSTLEHSLRGTLGDVLLALLLTNHGNDGGWLIVISVCIAAPVVLALTMRYLDRRRRK